MAFCFVFASANIRFLILPVVSLRRHALPIVINRWEARNSLYKARFQLSLRSFRRNPCEVLTCHCLLSTMSNSK
jgi:hypothetical protein